MRASLAALLVLFAPAVAQAEWLVLPIHAAHPPPSDPTLLRTSERVGRAIAKGVPVDVRLVARDIRDEHCTDDGHHCPTAIARLLDAERVVALELDDDLSHLTATIYRRPAVVVGTIQVGCTWSGGPSCDLEALVEQIREMAKGPFDPDRLEAAWTELRPRVEACIAKRKKKDGDVRVKFRIRPDGRATNVRIEPRRLQRQRAYACVARVVESLRVPPFEGDEPPLVVRALASP